MRNIWLPLLLLITGCTAKPAAEPIVLGLLTPRSGAQQAVGLAMEQGVLLAIDEAKDNPIQGRAVEVLAIDTAGDAKHAFHQAVRLVSINRVAAVIGGPDAATAEQLCRVGETYQLPALTLSWLPARQLGPFGFSVAAAPADRGKALGKFGAAADQPLAIVADSLDPAAPPLTAAFTAQVKNVVLQELYGQADIAKVAERAAATMPAAVLVAGNDLSPWREALAVPILFGGDLTGPALANIVWTTPFVPADAAAKVFAAKFESKFGAPPTVAAALAYDATRLWIESARKVELLQGVKVRDELRKWTDFPSSTGPLAIDDNHAARRLVYVLRDGQVIGSLREPVAPR